MIYKSPIETPEFADVFTCTGRLKRIVKIKLKENSVLHVAAPRKVPLAIHNKVKGLNSAPKEYLKAMDEIYEDEDLNPYFDDIALDSSTVEEHCR
ncbi:hypothetical protein TNIN_377381 [Trichonephila inaurata madagascariensis]|uniref:Uncharacterized protein n=1 Tax=Trichonephila inaurata madagascariensis TaxID=2747483 RepID=A0A8X6YEK0_9ARAC|nr:hypothetical protein TNIN_377381 [Trichonephila inaurata madagascariensis]